jgi:pilus assembly protein CpaC
MNIPAIIRFAGSALALCLFSNAPALAQVKAIEAGDYSDSYVSVPMAKSSVLRTKAAFATIVVSRPEIADVFPMTDHTFYLQGKSIGATNVLLYNKNRRLVDIVEVRVGHDIASLQRDLTLVLPNEKIKADAAAFGIYLSGTATSAPVALRAMELAERYAPDAVTNGIAISGKQQVLLEVRFIEASRIAIKEMGLGSLLQKAGKFSFSTSASLVGGLASNTSGAVNTSIGGTNVDLFLNALEEKGIIRTLAQPNLIALSGDTASFLAGGEFPFPVANRNDNISIEFRQFGIGLAFTPTVLSGGVINLKVIPEVSQLDQRNAIRIKGVEIPSLTVRRANTTVELRDGQSFAIAGMYQSAYTNMAQQTPWLADIPVLGALFRSTRFQRNETELVILITPHLVLPVDDINDLKTPFSNIEEPSEEELFLRGKTFSKGKADANPQSPSKTPISKRAFPRVLARNEEH